MGEFHQEIPEVHPELIDNDDIFDLKFWELLVVPAAAAVLYLLEAPHLLSVVVFGMIGLWRLHNCVRRLAFRDALHTQQLDRRIQILERNLASLQAGVDMLHRREAMSRGAGRNST